MGITNKNSVYFTIGIPVYNCEKFICDCIDSIVSQSFDDFEIICIDDNSSDNSFSFLSDYAKKDNRIKLFRNDSNMGVGKTRARIGELANSKYFVWIDADDTIDKGFFEKLYNLTRNYTTGRTLFIHNAVFLKHDKKYFVYNRKQWISKDVKEVARAVILGNNLYSYPWSFVIPTHLLKHISYPNNCRDYVDDQLISYKYCLFSDAIVFNGRVFGYNHFFRENSDSKNATFFYRLSNTYKYNATQFASTSKDEKLFNLLLALSYLYRCLGVLKDKNVLACDKKKTTKETQFNLKTLKVQIVSSKFISIKMKILLLTLKHYPLLFYIRYRNKVN